VRQQKVNIGILKTLYKNSSGFPKKKKYLHKMLSNQMNLFLKTLLY